jgi:hypothetical protein
MRTLNYLPKFYKNQSTLTSLLFWIDDLEGVTNNKIAHYFLRCAYNIVESLIRRYEN